MSIPISYHENVEAPTAELAIPISDWKFQAPTHFGTFCPGLIRTCFFGSLSVLVDFTNVQIGTCFGIRIHDADRASRREASHRADPLGLTMLMHENWKFQAFVMQYLPRAPSGLEILLNSLRLILLSQFLQAT